VKKIKHDRRKSLFGGVYLVDLRYPHFLLAAFLLFLSACVSRPNLDVPDQSPAQVEERVVVDGKVLPLPQGPNIRVQPMESEQPMSPVVRKLMETAQRQRQLANYDGAANSLERALRIEPRSALLWSQLADVRYAQESWQKAIQLAAKSNTLARNNGNLRRRNWYLMVNAYEATGNLESAQKYRDKLSR